jgi:Flp pilus assembly secretin CpaC
LTIRADPFGMRRLVLALVVALSPLAAAAASFEVPLDQAVRISLPAAAGDVIVGNSSIVDVTVADQRHLVITGKSAGVTNRIVTTTNGRPMFNRQIVVGTPQMGRVTLITGSATSVYACAAGCERVPSDELGTLSSGQRGSAPPAPSPGGAPATP